MILPHRIVSLRRSQRRGKNHHIAHLKGKAPQVAISEIIVRGLCQNLQKDHHRGLQNTRLPRAKEVEIQILEVIMNDTCIET